MRTARPPLVVLCACCAAVFTLPVVAAPTLIVTDTSYEGEASAEAYWVESVGQPTDQLTDYVFEDTSALAGGITAGAPGVAADAVASALGAIGLGVGGPGAVQLRGNVDVFGQTFATDVNGQPVPYSEAWASARSDLSADFTITNDTPDPIDIYIFWRLTADTPVRDVPLGTVSVSLDSIDHPASAFTHEILIETGAPNQLGGVGFWTTLAPGDYTLAAHGNLDFAEIQGGETENTGATYLIYVGLDVPEPNTAALLLLAAPTLIRRRRR